MENTEVTDHGQAQVTVTSMENANIPSFSLRKFMGRPVILRAGSKHLPALEMLSAVATTVGREVHVFLRPAALPASYEGSAVGPRPDDESDEYFEFTAEDYARTMAYKKEEVFLKTKKIRQAEEAARRARISKAVIRILFPDNYVLEAVFQPSDPVSLLMDLIRKVILRPDSAFYIYTTPPKQRIKNLQQTMYDAGLAPGALVYFSYESLKEPEGPYLRPEIVVLRDLHLLHSPVTNQEPASPSSENQSGPSNSDSSMEPKKEMKRPSGKPKWFKQR